MEEFQGVGALTSAVKCSPRFRNWALSKLAAAGARSTVSPGCASAAARATACSIVSAISWGLADLKREVAGRMADQVGLDHLTQMRPAPRSRHPCPCRRQSSGCAGSGQRLAAASTLVALLSLTQRTPLVSATVWLRCGRPGSGRRALDLARSKAEAGGRGIGGGGVLVVVFARQAVTSRRSMDATWRPLRYSGKALAAKTDQPKVPVLSRRHADHPSSPPHGHLVGPDSGPRVVDADDGAVGAAFGEEPALASEAAAQGRRGGPDGRARDCEDPRYRGSARGQGRSGSWRVPAPPTAVMGGVERQHAQADIAADLGRAAAFFRMWWISAVVVDLPFEPVMAMTRGDV